MDSLVAGGASISVGGGGTLAGSPGLCREGRDGHPVPVSCLPRTAFPERPLPSGSLSQQPAPASPVHGESGGSVSLPLPLILAPVPQSVKFSLTP